MNKITQAHAEKLQKNNKRLQEEMGRLTAENMQLRAELASKHFDLEMGKAKMSLFSAVFGKTNDVNEIKRFIETAEEVCFQGLNQPLVDEEVKENQE